MTCRRRLRVEPLRLGAIALAVAVVSALPSRGSAQERAVGTVERVDRTPAPSATGSARLPLATLTGTVFDSVHSAPLAKAVVLVEGASRMGFTSDNGSFTIDSIPAGKYRIHVDHELLDSLGLRMTTDPVELPENGQRTIALAIPSPETLVAVSCPAAQRGLGPSAIIGRVLDADTDKPVDSARVSYAWSEISLAAGLKRVPRVRGARTDADGVYRICGVPAEVEGTLQADKKGITTSEVTIVFRGQSLAIQGMRLGSPATVAKGDADSAQKGATGTTQRFSAPTVQKGSAILNGRVVGANGQPIVGARVDVEGTASRTLTKADGTFTLTELPSGTQTAVARQLGMAPVFKPVELSTRGPASVVITMSQPAQALETVVVKAEMDQGLERVGFLERKRGASGYFVTGEEVMKRAPNMLTDVFRTVPGLRVVPAGYNEYKVESARSTGLGAACVRYIIDSTPYEAVYPGDVDRMIPPWEVGGIEVYQGSAAPMQFQTAGQTNCTTIVIWSKFRLDQANRRKR